MCCGSPAKGASFGGKTKNVLIGREILGGWKRGDWGKGRNGRERSEGEGGVKKETRDG